MQNRLTFSLLNADHVQLNKRWNYHNVVSPFHRLYLIDNGTGMLSNPDQSLTLKKGFLYLIPSFTILNQTCPSFLSQYYIHFIEETADGSSLFAYNRKLMKVKSTSADLACFKRLLAINPGRDLRKSDDPKVYEKSIVLNSFRKLNARLPLGSLVETQGIIQILLSRFLHTDEYRMERKSLIPSRILEAINHIQTNLSGNITVEELAGRANLSADYFSRSFYRHTGLRPLQFIHQKRVERAQFLILTTNCTFAEISAETGFESLSYFARIFKRVTGQTPGFYRDNHLDYM